MMEMNRGRHLFRNLAVWLGVLLVLGMAALFAAEKDGIPLRFAPAEDIDLVETEKSTVVREFAMKAMDMSEKETEYTEKKTRIKIRRTEKGFAVTMTLVSVTAKKDGETTEPDPLDRYEKGIPVTFNLDNDGKLLGVEGLDKIVASGKRIIPKPMQEVMGDALVEKELAKAVSSLWESQIGTLIGRTVKPGDQWTTNPLIFLPDGKLAKYTLTTKAGSAVKVGTRDGIKLTYVLKTDEQQLAKSLTRLFSRDIGEDGPQLQVRLREEKWNEEVVMDTSLLYELSSKETHVTRVEMQGPEGMGTMEMAIRENAETTLTFGADAGTSEGGTGVWR